MYTFYLLHFSFQKLSKDLRDFHAFLLENRVTVGELWTLLQNYEEELRLKEEHIELYPRLKAYFSRSVPDSDPEGTADGAKHGTGCDADGGRHSHVAADGAIDNTVTGVFGGRDFEFDSEPEGCAPGEAGFDASPDYKIGTP